MPEPLSEAAAKAVEKLLREGLSAVEVSRRCIGRWPLVTPLRVRMEAYRLGIGLPRGARPGAPGAGRPRGSRDANPRVRAKTSPHRARIIEMRAAGMSMTDIAAELGLSKQRVSQLLSSGQ
jgi:hypothetical protein